MSLCSSKACWGMTTRKWEWLEIFNLACKDDSWLLEIIKRCQKKCGTPIHYRANVRSERYRRKRESCPWKRTIPCESQQTKYNVASLDLKVPLLFNFPKEIHWYIIITTTLVLEYLVNQLSTWHSYSIYVQVQMPAWKA